MSSAIYIHKLIIADSIHLVVTSPPYWNLKKYGEEGYSNRIKPMQNTCMKSNPFLKRSSELWLLADLLQLIMQAINVGAAVSNDEMKPINVDVIKMMKDLNFIFKNQIIWTKQKDTQGLWQRGEIVEK
jgi:DNA modification methylase